MARIRTPPLFEILELAYRLDLPTSEWLQRLAASIHIRRNLGPGVLAYELDISKRAGTGTLGMVKSIGAIEEFDRNTEPLHRNISTGIYHRVLSNGTHCSTIRTRLEELGLSLSDYPVLEEMVHSSGAVDIWAVSTVNPDGQTLTFAIPLAFHYIPNRREAERWRKIGIHIAAGHRLRRRISGAKVQEEADAVVRPDGKVLHLRERAKPQREEFKNVVTSIDRARARDFRTGGNRTLELWKGLLAGEWSLLDWTDTDEKRFILALRNDPEAIAPAQLTRREAQVATYVAQGHPYKVVAYEMGLSISTVGTHIRQVLRKLGLASPAELAWIYGQLVVRDTHN
jgi:DNA-binding CsgD family transcriptional regulator